MLIEEKISSYLQNHDFVNIVIAGSTCSGKTTLANRIWNYFSNEFAVTVVAQDDYFKNLPDIPRTQQGYLTDSIQAFHTVEFKHDVKMLLQNGIVTMPRYDVPTNTRICKNKIVRRGTINIFEGLHAIELLSDLENCITIFIDTDIEICLKRRIERDTSKYGIPEARIRQYWSECIRPMYDRFIFPQREKANIIMTCEGGDKNGT